MEKSDQVIKAIGKKSFQILIEEITEGMLTKDHLKQIALLMKGGVHGVFMANKDQKENVFLFQLMLDRWYQTTLYKTEVVAFELLIKILEDRLVGLEKLADRMKKKKHNYKLNKWTIFLIFRK